MRKFAVFLFVWLLTSGIVLSFIGAAIGVVALLLRFVGFEIIVSFILTGVLGYIGVMTYNYVYDQYDIKDAKAPKDDEDDIENL
jgi:hypothetical protein